MAYGYHSLDQFPKSQKYTLGQDIRLLMQEVLRFAIRGGKRTFKKTTLDDFDIALEALRTFVRIAKDLRYLSFKRYERWSRYLADIGSMLGGWIKSVKK